MMISKKAQGLSVNFLVKFILAVTIFGMGVALMWAIYDNSTSTMKITQSEFDNRLFDLNCRSTETLCIASAKDNINSGDNILIGAKIYNNIDRTITGYIKADIYDKNSEVNSPEVKIMPEDQEVNIEPKGSKEFTFAVVTTKNAPKGKYIVNFELVRDNLGNIPGRYYFDVK
ncbi:MAG: hypothetical protein ACQER9_01515 [Nanobdellota archaeon]